MYITMLFIYLIYVPNYFQTYFGGRGKELNGRGTNSHRTTNLARLMGKASYTVNNIILTF